MNSKLEVLPKGLIKLVKVVFVLSNFREHIKGLFDQVLSDDFENFILLKSFSRNIKG
uniref:Uncharacterized protein n=1 Tax=Phakopsora pachyrhizi TaxID=170000 RepID=A0A0S1MIP3_PHAPC